MSGPWSGPPCEVCGSPLIGRDQMCPSRYLSPHDDREHDRVSCMAWCLHMAGDDVPAAWRSAWALRGILAQPPLTIVPWPG